MNLREALAGKIKGDVPRSFDVVGDIAIVEIPKALQKKEKLIGETILKLNNHIKTVVRKHGAHKGQLRIQETRIIAGKRKKVTESKEYGVRLKLHLDKTYYSIRYGVERKRIADQVKPGEEVLVMFSGIAPFPLVIAKNAKAKNIVAVELNKEAHEFAKENIKLNKVTTIQLHQGDVRKVVPKLRGNFDRIVMPLPKGGEHFLDIALSKIKKGGIIHFYDFLHEDNFKEARDKIKQACKKEKKTCVIQRSVKCGQQGPGIYRICVDFKV